MGNSDKGELSAARLGTGGLAREELRKRHGGGDREERNKSRKFLVSPDLVKAGGEGGGNRRTWPHLEKTKEQYSSAKRPRRKTNRTSLIKGMVHHVRA
jgi:hypothetical protein